MTPSSDRRLRQGRLRRALRRRPGTEGEGPGGVVERELDQLDGADRAIVERALPHTMTGVARLASLVDAVRYCAGCGIPGAIAECGVWRGGSVLAVLLTLHEMGVRDRDVYLYDTFEGMTEPTPHDVSRYSPPALDEWRRARAADGRAFPELFDHPSFDAGSVRALLAETDYPLEHVHLVEGPVEKTIPDRSPGPLALLRLDTDWYESTLHELTHLYPLLEPGGILIVDDYGHWDGCRKAVDEYFPPGQGPFLSRIDYTGRIAVKPG